MNKRKTTAQNIYLPTNTSCSKKYTQANLKAGVLLFFLIIFIVLNTFSQTNFVVNNFSKKYKGIITIEKGYENEVFKKGKTSIVDTKTNKEILTIESDELIFDLKNYNTSKKNISTIPYNKQDIIIWQDFNFDNTKDLAIMDGLFSCYHGPSFQIYLNTKNELKHSPEFTRLAQEYCGMFQLDYQTKTIHTTTKSGCCWHKHSSFKVVNNTPKPIATIIEEPIFDSPFIKKTKTTWKETKVNTEVSKYINFNKEGISKIVSFNLIDTNKQVVVFKLNNRVLYYSLLKPNKTIDFSYPTIANLEKPDFKISKSKDKLIFSYKNATYTIYNTYFDGKITKAGVIVTSKGKSHHLKGDVNSLKGSLNKLKEANLLNVARE